MINKKTLLFLLCIPLSNTPNFFRNLYQYTGLETIKTKIEEELKPTIAVVEIKGPIVTAQNHIKTLLEASNAPETSALVLIINSGGGAAGASENISREIAKIREKMPVIVWIENTCCSGAYLIASSASMIIAPKMSQCGSIGVYITYMKTFPQNFSDQSLTGDIKVYPCFSGNHKPHPYMPITLEQQEHIQKRSNNIYQSFYEYVAEERNLPLDQITEWADGKSFDGEQALKLGLIDSIGTFTDALELAEGFTKKRFKGCGEIATTYYITEPSNSNQINLPSEFYLSI